MRNTKNIFKLRFINTLLFVALIYIQYNGVFSLKIANANPMLPLALFVAMCMFCSELSAALSGLIIGVFIDSVSSTPQGFNAIIFSLLGLGIALTVRHLFNNNIRSAITLSVICTTIYFLIRWVFSIAFAITFTENLTYIMQTVLPSVLYTSAINVPFYYLEKALYTKFY